MPVFTIGSNVGGRCYTLGRRAEPDSIAIAARGSLLDSQEIGATSQIKAGQNREKRRGRRKSKTRRSKLIGGGCSRTDSFRKVSHSCGSSVAIKQYRDADV